MFTGIVQKTCSVIEVLTVSDRQRFDIDLGALADGLQVGASVAVAGACLTAVAVAGGRVSFDVIPETLAHTSLGRLRAGAAVNIERSLRFGDEVGGHVLSGHITGTARVTAVSQQPGECRVVLQAPASVVQFVFHKGFIALDGASLTVAAVDRAAGHFEVALIPETLRRTTFGRTAVGQVVNVEIDATTRAIVETVERMLLGGLLTASMVQSSAARP